jgi:hypothetical protein
LVDCDVIVAELERYRANLRFIEGKAKWRKACALKPMLLADPSVQQQNAALNSRKFVSEPYSRWKSRRILKPPAVWAAALYATAQSRATPVSADPGNDRLSGRVRRTRHGGPLRPRCLFAPHYTAGPSGGCQDKGCPGAPSLALLSHP